MTSRCTWVARSLCLIAGFAWIAPISAQEAVKDHALGLCDKARTLAKGSDLVEADNAFREAVKALDDLTPKRGQDAAYWDRYYQCLNDQAKHWGAMERFAEAEKLYKNTLFVLPTLQTQKFPSEPSLQLTLAQTHVGLADLYRNLERSGPAVAAYEEGLKVLRNLVKQYPAGRDYCRELAEVLNKCALEMMKQARFRDAELAYREELQVWHKLVQENPNVPDYREGLATAYNAYGTLARESGRFMLARDLIRAAIQVAQPIMDAYPTQPKNWRSLPAFYRNLTMTLENLRIHVERAGAARWADRCDDKLQSLPREAGSTYTEADIIFTCLRRRGVSATSTPGEDMESLLAKVEKQTKAFPQVPSYRSQLAAARIVIGTHLATGHIYDKSIEFLRAALVDSDALVKDFPKVPKYSKLRGSTLARLGMVLYMKDQPKEGEQCIQAAYATYRQLGNDFPDEPTLARAEDEEMDPLMRFMLDRGDHQKALEIMALTMGQRKKLVERYPTCPQYRIFCATTQQSEGYVMLSKMKNEKGAEEAFRLSVQMWSQAITDFPHIVELYGCQAQAKSYLLQLYNRQKRWADAEAMVLEIMPSRQKLIDAAPQMARFHADLAVDNAWLATLAIEQRRPDKAVERFNLALALCEKAFSMQPTEREYLLLLRESYRARGEVQQQAGNFAAYQNDQQRGSELGEWLDSTFVRLTRVRQRAEDGKIDLARREADDLFAGIELTGAQWYELAGIYARLVKTNDPAQREQVASRAVASLGNALRNGYQPTVPFSDEEQFRPFFARADFQQLCPVRPAGR